MAADFIVIMKTSRPQQANQAIALANHLLDECDRVRSLAAAANRQWDTGVYTKLKAQFGLADDTDAAAFMTLLTNLDNCLNGTTAMTGAERRAAINEFITRLAGQ